MDYTNHYIICCISGIELIIENFSHCTADCSLPIINFESIQQCNYFRLSETYLLLLTRDIDDTMNLKMGYAIRYPQIIEFRFIC